MRNVCLLLLLVLAAPMAARVVTQEAIMLWYGNGLVPAAYAAAEKTAKGSPYCVIDHDGADSFESLNKRRILLDAFLNRGYTTPVNPHFGISVNGTNYWWSFKRREFLQLPEFSSWASLPTRHRCRALNP
jgi:hypothetical protein